MMILRADSSGIDSPPSVLTDTFRPAPDREKGPRNKARTPPGESCLHCSGFVSLSDMASLESDVTGTPMELWRCINCGDYLDSDILANRWKDPVPACEIAD